MKKRGIVRGRKGSEEEGIVRRGSEEEGDSKREEGEWGGGGE